MGLERPLLPDKQFFTVGEASRIAQVPVHTLRYWEEQFRALRPVRRESGHRRYTRADVETILRIKDLLQVRRLTTAGARKALIERERGSGAKAEEGGAARMPAQAARIVREVRDELRTLIEVLSN